MKAHLLKPKLKQPKKPSEGGILSLKDAWIDKDNAKVDKLVAKNGKIFAANMAAIAIMRSLYSNSDVNLQYPYFISDKNPFWIEMHTKADGKFTKIDSGFVYIVNSDGFKNEPETSWQFVREADEVNIIAIIETESNDFVYPVKIFNYYNPQSD